MAWNDRFLTLLAQWGGLYGVAPPPTDMHHNDRVIYWLEAIRDAI